MGILLAISARGSGLAHCLETPPASLPCTEGSEAWGGCGAHSPRWSPGAVAKVVLGSAPFLPKSVVSHGQVCKLQSSLGTSDEMVTSAPQGNNLLSQTKKWEKTSLVTDPNAWPRGNDHPRKKQSLKFQEGS